LSPNLLFTRQLSSTPWWRPPARLGPTAVARPQRNEIKKSKTKSTGEPLADIARNWPKQGGKKKVSQRLFEKSAQKLFSKK
jgi:hypothetical protein